MHFSYLDDSGSDRKSPIVIVGAVLIKEQWVQELEIVRAMIAERLIPEERLDTFEEFHAADLFHGRNAFEDLPLEDRRGAIQSLLNQVSRFSIPFIYSAVNRAALASSASGSANPIDVAFRMCGLGIEWWFKQNQDQDGFTVFICDDTENKELKKQLRTSFRSMRARIGPPKWSFGRMWHIHEDMYFGSSAECTGIQIADICNYILNRKLNGMGDAEDLFATIEQQAICSKAEPEWSQYKGIFVEAL